MARSNWIAGMVALALIAGTGAVLAKLGGRRVFDAPGVKVGAAPVLGPDGVAVARQGVMLADSVPNCSWTNMPISRGELDGLPKDTAFGRRMYTLPNGMPLQLTVVVMGSDRSSIHEPEYCLTGSGWSIDKTERTTIPMDRPFPYQLPVNKMTVSRLTKTGSSRVQINGVYIYWFVSGTTLTALPMSGMMWSIAKTLLENGRLERWAYVSCFCPCAPGREDAAFDGMKEFIRASVPQFQLVPTPGTANSAHAPGPAQS